MKKAITITFSECVENHKGMQKIGTLADHGCTCEDLLSAKQQFEQAGVQTELIHLNKSLPKELEEKSTAAYVLVIRKGATFLTALRNLQTELENLDWDRKAKMYGRVVNKNARYNLCFADISQPPSYEEGKGRVVSFSTLPYLNEVRTKLAHYFPFLSSPLYAEGNYYYDIRKTGIGFHGDSERRLVIACRIGASTPLHFQWYERGIKVGQRRIIELYDGDMYCMSEKATGNDWKRQSILTLRHATGCSKFTA